MKNVAKKKKNQSRSGDLKYSPFTFFMLCAYALYAIVPTIISTELKMSLFLQLICCKIKVTICRICFFFFLTAKQQTDCCGIFVENKQGHIAATTVPINIFKIHIHSCECFNVNPHHGLKGFAPVCESLQQLRNI